MPSKYAGFRVPLVSILKLGFKPQLELTARLMELLAFAVVKAHYVGCAFIDEHARPGEIMWLALVFHRTAHHAWTLGDTLRAFDDAHLIMIFRENIQRGRIHLASATGESQTIIGGDGQATAAQNLSCLD